MVNNRDADVAKWVGERLANLMPDSEYHPNAIRALARFQSLRAKRGRQVQFWGWTTAVASAALLCALALPAPRAAAQRFLDFYHAALRQGVPMPDRPERKT